MVIKVYTSNKDPYSDMLKNLLKYYSIQFENIETNRNQLAFEEMVKISGQRNTPVLVIDDKVFVGFDRDMIKEVLGINKQETSSASSQNQVQESHSDR